MKRKVKISFLCTLAAAACLALPARAATLQEWLFDQPAVGASFTTVNQVPGGNTPSQQKHYPTDSFANLQVAGGKWAASTGMLQLNTPTIQNAIAYGASSIDFSTLSAFTIEMWINPSSSTQNGDIINVDGHILRTYGNNPAGLYLLGLNYNSNGGNNYATSGYVFLGAANQWMDIAMTWDNSSNMVKIYLNGVLQNTSAMTSPINNNANVSIGAFGPNNTPYQGDIDEIRISDVALLPGDGSGNGTIAWNASLVAAVPEPGSLALLSISAVAFVAWKSRRRS
ncbi:MAG: LamG-like jellyroll fold domain-containing protein [Chthoniobacterales bacterium]